MSISEKKSKLRRELLDQRASIPNEDWVSRSNQIIDKLSSLDEIKSANKIHCFVSMNERNEVNTHELIQQMLRLDKVVIVPKTNFETGNLEHSELSSFDDLSPNKWGVLELTYSSPNVSDLDIVLVPLLAADKSFNRLGYGKGFYDKFLNSTKALKIGLFFDEFIFDEIPVEDFDEKLDILITEKKTLRRNNSDLAS